MSEDQGYDNTQDVYRLGIVTGHLFVAGNALKDASSIMNLLPELGPASSKMLLNLMDSIKDFSKHIETKCSEKG